MSSVGIYRQCCQLKALVDTFRDFLHPLATFSKKTRSDMWGLLGQTLFIFYRRELLPVLGFPSTHTLLQASHSIDRTAAVKDVKVLLMISQSDLFTSKDS